MGECPNCAKLRERLRAVEIALLAIRVLASDDPSRPRRQAPQHQWRSGVLGGTCLRCGIGAAAALQGEPCIDWQAPTETETPKGGE
jgi:hypothetical protein